MPSEFDHIKKQWQSLNNATGNEFKPQMILRSTRTNAQRIATVYRRLVICCAIWVAISLTLPTVMFPLWLSIALAVYFLFGGCINWYVMVRAERIDLSSVTLVDAMNSVCEFQTIRLRMKLLTALAAVPMLAVMLRHFYFVNMSLFLGGVGGLIAGAIIGQLIDHRIKVWIREMKRELAGVN